MAENQALLAVLEQRFTDLAERIDESRQETRQRFDQLEGEVRQTGERLGRFEVATGERFEQLEGQIRQNSVQIEALRGEVHQVAEGVVAVDEKLTEKLDQFRLDVDHQFDDVRALIRLSYGQLEQRLSTLENRYEVLDSRLTALESGRH